MRWDLAKKYRKDYLSSGKNGFEDKWKKRREDMTHWKKWRPLKAGREGNDEGKQKKTHVLTRAQIKSKN